MMRPAIKTIEPMAMQMKRFPVPLALRMIRSLQSSMMDETVELALHTGLQPKYPEQNLRGVVAVPHGTGKTAVVAVFATGAKADEAREAGADIVGGIDLVESILAGEINFTKCISTPEMIPVIAKLGRTLGPKGLMPNNKSGSITVDVGDAVRAAHQGEIKFRVDKVGGIQVPLGKLSFTDEMLNDNISIFMNHLWRLKPAKITAKKFIISAALSSTMGKGCKMDLTDPLLSNRAK